MKIRTSFVSNSSSSSFILALERKPLNSGELQRWLFGNDLVFPNPFPWNGCHESFPAKDIAERVFQDLKDQDPINPEELADHIDSGWFAQELFNFEQIREFSKREDGTIDWDKLATLKKEEADLVAEKFRHRWGERQFFKVTYSDGNTGPEEAMEHGDLFAQIPHIKISHH